MPDKNRLEYFDALRGLAMLLVVTGHVILFVFESDSFNFIASFFCETLELPLFFMISGFFIVKVKDQQLNKNSINKIINKIPKLIISAFLFMSLFCVTHNICIVSCLKSTSKIGYWFTFSLFEFILTYQIFDLLICSFNLNYKTRRLMLLYLFILFSLFYPCLDKIAYEKCVALYRILGLYYFQFFSYFLFGALLHLYICEISMILREGRYVTYNILLLITIILLRNLNISVFQHSVVAYFFEFCYSLLAISLTYKTFRDVSFFSQSKIMGSALKIIGKHSLSIYFLHYFFLQMDLSYIGLIFQKYSAPLIEFIFAGFVALLIVTVCLIVSKVLRQSPFISKFLLN